MFIIESKFGNDGYAMWFKILETLAKTDDHWIDLQDESNMMFLSAKCKVDESVLIDFIESAVKLGEFDALLWNEQKVIWSDKFVDSVGDAYRKRNNECMNKAALTQHLEGLGRKLSGKGSGKGGENPQSKGEDSKEDENIEKQKHRLVFWIEENAPTVNKMEEPLTYKECENLKEDFDKEFIIELFEQMHNYKPLLSKNKNTNLTFRNWANRDGRYEKWLADNGRVKITMNT